MEVLKQCRYRHKHEGSVDGMNGILYDWLREEFYKGNINKYRHYFEVWVENLTQPQIDGFTKQMYNKKNNVLGEID